jgi:hypothetical protein
MADFTRHAGQFRIVIEEADGALFQWRNTFSDREAAESYLKEAQEEFPTEDGHSAATVQELMSNDEDNASEWVEVS